MDPVTQATWCLVWATWALVVVTALLAVVGGVYAWFTLGILREQEKTSAAQIKPILAPRLRRLDHHPLANVVLYVKNYGLGAALGVNAVVRFEPGDTLRYEFRTTGIASGEDYPILLESGEVPPLQLDNLINYDKYTHLHLTGTCTDVSQRQCTFDVRVPLAEGTSYPGIKIIREMLERQGVFPPQQEGPTGSAGPC